MEVHLDQLASLSRPGAGPNDRVLIETHNDL
jgi:hypothetical protein